MLNGNLLHKSRFAFTNLINDVIQVCNKATTETFDIVALLNKHVETYLDKNKQQIPDYTIFIHDYAHGMNPSNKVRFLKTAQVWLDARGSMLDSLSVENAIFPKRQNIEEYLTTHYNLVKTILILRDENEFLFDDELTRTVLRSVIYADSEFSEDRKLWKHSLYSPYCLNLLYEVYDVLDSYFSFVNSVEAKQFIAVSGILSSFSKVLSTKIGNLFSCQCFDNGIEYFVELNDLDKISVDSFLVGKNRKQECSVHSVDVLRLGEKLIEFYKSRYNEPTKNKYKALIIGDGIFEKASLELLLEMEITPSKENNRMTIGAVWDIEFITDCSMLSFSQIAQQAADKFNAVFYLDNVGLYKNKQQDYNVSFDEYFADTPDSYLLLKGEGISTQINDYARTLMMASAMLNGLSTGSLLLYKKVFDYSKLKHIASFQKGEKINQQRLYFYSSILPSLTDNELIKTYLTPTSEAFVCRDEVYDGNPMTILAVDNIDKNKESNLKYKIDHDDEKMICISAWQIIKGLKSNILHWHDWFKSFWDINDAVSINELISNLRDISLEISYVGAGSDIYVNITAKDTKTNVVFQNEIASFLCAFIKIAYDYRESSSLMNNIVSSAKDLIFDEFARVFQAAISGRCRNFNDILFLELMQNNRRALPAKITVSENGIKKSAMPEHQPVVKKDRKYLQMMLRTMSKPKMSTTDELSARRLCLCPGDVEPKYDLFSPTCEKEYYRDLEAIAQACVNLGYSQSNICRNTGVRV